MRVLYSAHIREENMSTDSIRLERRAAQRFDVHLPVTVRLPESTREGQGFTQDLSARGVFLYTDFPLSEGEAVELTLVMPSEITLAESMPVRCRGTVLRIAQMTAGSKTGVAVHLEGYEYLPEAASVTEVFRTSDSYDRAEQEEAGASAHTFNFRPIAI
jgi:hypothetical protein